MAPAGKERHDPKHGNLVDEAKHVADEHAARVESEAVRFHHAQPAGPFAERLAADEQLTRREVDQAAQLHREHPDRETKGGELLLRNRAAHPQLARQAVD